MKMEVSITSVAVSLLLITTLTWLWSLLNWLWLKPKKLERILRQQGLKGNSYRFFYGDTKENRMMMMMQEASSRPFDFSHDLPPRVMPLFYQTVQKYGKDSFTWLGPIPRVTIMRPEHVKEVFTKVYDFQKPKINPLGKLLASGVADYDGEKWAKHRKIINPAFHIEKLKLMMPAFYHCCNEMISKWEKLVSTNDGSSELDVWPHLQNLSCDVISRTAFGSNYEEGKRIFDLLKEQTNIVMKIIHMVYIPGWRFLPTKTNRRMKAIDKDIRASLTNIISKRENAMKAGEATNNDLLDILLLSNLTKIQEHGNDEHVGMSIQDVLEECKLFYFAGQETTSTLLVWTMILLSKYTTWQAKARDEVLQVIGDSMPDFDGLNHLKVVTMILYEVLRLYSPASFMSRAVNEPIKLGNMQLPSGVNVFVPTLFLHQDRENWGDDALDFNPERFSAGVSKATNNQVSFIPFGYGPRICVGQNFALVEAKMAMALILRSFSFELSPSYSHSPDATLILQPKNGAPLVLHRLN